MAKRLRKLELSEDMWLTQVGERPPGDQCRDHLRTEIGETEMSLILGDVDATAGSAIVFHRVSELAYVRCTLVGMLWEAKFVVEHSPTGFNPLHVSVYAPPGIDGIQAEWDDGVAELFRGCFDSAMDTEREVPDDSSR